MVITGGIVILLMLEPHLSASIIIMALAIVMMFVGGIKLSYLLIGMGGAGALLLIAGKFVPLCHKRIVSWRDPFADTSAAGYQIVQSLYSIGSGGFLGLGLGEPARSTTCRRSTMTTSFPSSVRSLAMSAPSRS